MTTTREQGGLIGDLKRIGLGAAVAIGFLRLYMLPTIPNELPRSGRVVTFQRRGTP